MFLEWEAPRVSARGAFLFANDIYAARMERGQCDTRLSTVMRLLAPLGKTLAIVPLEKE